MYKTQPIGIRVAMFTNGPEETGVQSQDESYQRLQKWNLMPPCLTLIIIRYGSRVSGAIQGKELHAHLYLDVVAIAKRDFGSPSTKVALDYGHPTYLYLYICMNRIWLLISRKD